LRPFDLPFSKLSTTAAQNTETSISFARNVFRANVFHKPLSGHSQFTSKQAFNASTRVRFKRTDSSRLLLILLARLTTSSAAFSPRLRMKFASCSSPCRRFLSAKRKIFDCGKSNISMISSWKDALNLPEEVLRMSLFHCPRQSARHRFSVASAVSPLAVVHYHLLHLFRRQ
jgi:hypothetical protein